MGDRVRQQVRSERGAEADLRATVGVYKNGPFQAGIFGQATWADRKSMRTYYGQPGFDPSGSLLFASAGPLASYDIDRHWTVLGSLEGRRLQGDAARSPLAEKKSSYYAVAGVAYRF
jgi:outer membrane scaffolding protein for murein synthesis (MipA/OmpV family)